MFKTTRDWKIYIQKYLNLELFKKFEILDVDLHWNDYDLCFPSYDLYLGRCA